MSRNDLITPIIRLSLFFVLFLLGAGAQIAHAQDFMVIEGSRTNGGTLGQLWVQVPNSGTWTIAALDTESGQYLYPQVISWPPGTISGPEHAVTITLTQMPIQVAYFNLTAQPGRYLVSVEKGSNSNPAPATFRHPANTPGTWQTPLWSVPTLISQYTNPGTPTPSITISVGITNASQVTFAIQPLGGGTALYQTVNVNVNGDTTATWTNLPWAQTYEWTIVKGVQTSGFSFSSSNLISTLAIPY